MEPKIFFSNTATSTLDVNVACVLFFKKSPNYKKNRMILPKISALVISLLEIKKKETYDGLRENGPQKAWHY